MITSGQIKAARALLGMTATELAEKSGVAYTTIVRIESSEGVPSGQVKTLDSVQRALEKAGKRACYNKAWVFEILDWDFWRIYKVNLKSMLL